MKKINKFLLSTSSVLAVTAPVAAVISCGDSNSAAGSYRYDADNGDKIKVMTAFSKDGPQYKGLTALQTEWNKYATAHSKKKLEIIPAEGGYPAIPSNLSTSFEAKDTKKIPNMVIGYPDTLGTIGKYDMTTPLTKDDSIKGLFPASFTAINDQIGGVAPGNMYALPFAKSIDMMSINTPVMHHIFTLAEAAGIVTDTTHVLSSWNHATADHAAVEDLWGASLQNVPATVQNFGDINEILSSSGKLLDFITYIRPMLHAKDDAHQWILGMDSATNFVYQAVAEEVNNDIANKFLFSKGADGYMKYNWDNASSPARQAFNKVYGKIEKALKAKALYFNTGGAYSSNEEVQHKIGMAFGSTAGYKFNYLPGGTKAIIGGKVVTSHTDILDQSGKTATVLGSFSSYKNKIYLSTDTAHHGSHDIVLADATKDTTVQAFITNHTTTGSDFFVSSANEVATVPANDKIQITTGDYPKYLIFTAAQNKDGATLQENELEIKNTPWKFASANSEVQLVQGPSIIGVHTNAAGDAALADFTNWLMKGGSITTTIGRNTYTGSQPYEIFAQIAGYIVPTKTAFSGNKPSWVNNPALNLTYDTLKSIASDQNKFAFDNPVDDTTGNFRKVLQSTISSQVNSPADTMDAAGIYQAVKRAL